MNQIGYEFIDIIFNQKVHMVFGSPDFHAFMTEVSDGRRDIGMYFGKKVCWQESVSVFDGEYNMYVYF